MPALRALPLCALALLALGALAFDLTLPSRLPDEAAWAEAVALLRARAQPGDAVQLWPPWAERARLFVDAAPVLAEEDLRAADYLGVSRLWLLALPASPHAHVERAEAALRARGATPAGEPVRLRGLSLQAWALHPAPVAADLVAQRRPGAHEVDYVSRECLVVPVGAPGHPERLALRGPAGATFHLRAGIVGERAFDEKPPVEIRALVDGAPLAQLTVPRAKLHTPGWLAVDAALPPGADERTFELTFASPDPRDRPLCIAAWTTR